MLDCTNSHTTQLGLLLVHRIVKYDVYKPQEVAHPLNSNPGCRISKLHVGFKMGSLTVCRADRNILVVLPEGCEGWLPFFCVWQHSMPRAYSDGENPILKSPVGKGISHMPSGTLVLPKS